MKVKRFITPSFVIGAVVCLFLVFFGKEGLPGRDSSAKASHRTSGAMQALDFWAAARAYPHRTIPDIGHYAAFEYSRENMRGELDRSASATTWSALGPHNIGGRTLAVAFNPLNPNTVYAGSASGGLWRSHTGGVGADAWDQVPTGFPVLGVGSIAIAPDDSNTIYIATGEVYGYQDAIGGLTIRTTRGSYGIGILKTTDGGTTWVKSLDWSYNQKRGVQAVRINPQNHNTIWAATTEGTYKSLDAGVTWTQVHAVIMATDVVINHLDTNTVFVACGNLGSSGMGIYRTTNGGTGWTQLTTGLPASFGGKAHLALYQASPNVIYASIGNGTSTGAGTWLSKSTNNGTNWSTASTQDYATYQGWYSHFVGVNPVDSGKVICGGIDLWKSTTGGTNLVQKTFWYLWYFGVVPPGGPEGPSNYSHADHHAIAYHPANPNIIYFGTDGGVFRTTDGGETFSGCNGGFQSTQFYNGFSSAATDSLIAIGGMQDNATAIYEGTVAWNRVLGGDGCWTAIHSVNPDTMYGTYQYLSIQKSVNGGASWFGVAPPSSAIESFAAPYLLSPSRPRTMYAGRDKIFKSTQGGGGWVATNGNMPLDGNPAISLAVSSTSPDTVYAGTAPVTSRARIFMTTNGGTSWQNITGTLPDRYPVDIAVDPGNSATVYVAFSGFGTSHLFKSTNAGQSWVDIGSTLPDVPTSAVVVDEDHPDNVYVGNDIGVYVSSTGGGTWQEFQLGMPDAAIVMDLSISKTNRMLRAATHGNGIFERRLLDTPGSAPVMAVSTHQIVDSVSVGLVDTTSYMFSIGNNNPAAGPLTFSITENPAVFWLSVHPSSGSVGADSSRLIEVHVDFTAALPGDYTTSLIVAGNDPVNSSDTVHVDFTIAEASVNIAVSLNAGWNLISNPVTRAANADSVRQLYPNSVYQHVFAFTAGTGYEQRYTMPNGPGFWGKFPASETNSIMGSARDLDSITVTVGWNIVGSISGSVDTSAIVSVPPGIRGSDWFGYSLGYGPVGVIEPGRAYWVKATAPGVLVLTTGPTHRTQKVITTPPNGVRP